MKYSAIFLLAGIWAVSLLVADEHEEKRPLAFTSSGRSARVVRPGHPEWPTAWTTYRRVKSPEEDIRDLQAHGVGLISCRVTSSQKIRQWLDVARRTGMKYHIDLAEVTEEAKLVNGAGLEPVSAIMIGGVYDGKAIDRHVFSFTAGQHEILVEPPVHSARRAILIAGRTHKNSNQTSYLQ
jgi:hypothetical protein